MAQSGSALSHFLLFLAVAIVSLDPAKSQSTTVPVTLGFEHGPWPYIVSEHIDSRVCIQVRVGVPQSLLHLSLTTVDGTATASADYTNTTADLTFGPSTRKRCVLIPVINDMVPENQEYFRVKLAMTTPLPGIVLNPDIVTVLINDDDVIVGFEHGPYNISEGIGSINVCVQVKNGVLHSLLHLSLTTMDGTATVSADYANTTADLRFGPRNRSQCVLIPVINDMVPENQEYFRVKLAMTTPLPGIVLTPDTTTIVINDDDLVLGFENGSYHISEGMGSIQVCVQVKDGVPQSLLYLSLATVDGNATASADYANTTADLTFGPSTRKRCVLIPVINDVVPENQEYFRVKLAMTTQLPGIVLTPDTATIVINDDDVILGFEHATYSTHEGNGSVEVCIQVKSGVLWSSLYLSLTTVDGNAVSSADYANTTADLRFGPSSGNHCVLIPVINDMVPEVPEHFRVMLAMTTPLPGIVLNPDSTTVDVHDDDVVPEPEIGCTIELFVLASTQEQEQQRVVETVQEVLPDLLSTTDNTTNDTTISLPSVYNSLAVEFGVKRSDSGFSKFVEAVNEITEAKQEACSGALDERPSVDDVPRLVQEFRAAVGATQRDLSILRRIFGQMLCVKDQTGRSDSTGRKRRQMHVSRCNFSIDCYERTPEECRCPPGGIEGDCISCSCEFFRCLDPEDVLKPILGFVPVQLPCLAFVVDTTGSMQDEIDDAVNVIRSFVGHVEDEPACYVLTPFTDTEDNRFAANESVGPITKANTEHAIDLQNFLEAVGNLSAHGGGDCEEYALDGILRTLLAHDDGLGFMTAGSQIIVVTDAPSKNTAIKDKVINLARKLGVCIHFFLGLDTHNCFSWVPGSVEEYRHIAERTSGLVFGVSWNFSNFVASYKDYQCSIDLDSPDVSRGKRSVSVHLRCRSFQVSQFTNLLKLSVRPSETGLSVVTVRKPSGNTTTPVLSGFAVFSESHPESGKWSVCVERGTVEVYTSLKTTLDVVVLYLKNESHLSGAVPTTSNTPPACTEGRIAVLTSQSAEISSAYLNVIGNRQVVAHVPLHKCSKFLIGNTTFPLGTFNYELRGEDQDGNPFIYDTKNSIIFGPGNSYFSLSAVNGTNLEIDLYDFILLTYELHNTNPYGLVTFNFTAEPIGGFHSFLWPYQATVSVGESVQVTITARVGSSRIRRGSSHRFTVTATNGCTTLSASKTVSIRAPPTTPPPPDLCGCQNGGTCIIIERRGRQFPRCRCPPEFAGAKCHITIRY